MLYLDMVAHLDTIAECWAVWPETVFYDILYFAFSAENGLFKYKSNNNLRRKLYVLQYETEPTVESRTALSSVA